VAALRLEVKVSAQELGLALPQEERAVESRLSIGELYEYFAKILHNMSNHNA
jgi:hypothetical protein